MTRLGDWGSQRDRDELDRYITGNWGKDQFTDDEALEEWCSEAYALGEDHARAAASWITDGNDTDESRKRKLQIIEMDGPDAIINRPNLSGKYADDPTPQSIAHEIIGDEVPPEIQDALAEAYESGITDSFETACIAELRMHMEEK